MGIFYVKLWGNPMHGIMVKNDPIGGHVDFV
jgi:hypothetical protein